jgi:type I restriction enzyme S subunit
VAPIAEQVRIVAKIEELFSDLDAGVAALERVKANLKRYRASVLKAAVEGRLTAPWRQQHPDVESASKLLERILTERRRKWQADQLAKFKAAGKTPPKNWQAKYKEPAAPGTGTTNLPELPKGWCWATVDQCSLFTDYGTSAKTSSDNDGVPVLRMGNLRMDGTLDLEELKYLPDKHAEFPALILKSGDLLFNRTNSAELVGKTAVYRGVPYPCSFASYLIRARLSSEVRPHYVAACLSSRHGRLWIKTVVNQTAGQANVNGTKLASFTFPLPPVSEQHEITNNVECRLSVIEVAEIEIDHGLKRAARLRQAILKRAFEGKLVPQDPTDEPADKLLARIRSARQTEPRSRKKPKGKQQGGEA